MDDTSDRAVAFSRTANGNVAPLRVIDFKALQIGEKRTYGWAVDTINNEVAGTFQQGNDVGDSGAVYVFDRTGQTGVLRSIAGAATGLADPHGIYIDTVNNELVVTNEGHRTAAASEAPSVTVFARSANGNVTPLRAVQGSLTGLSNPKHVFVDTVNNELVVANSTDADSITVFARSANGNVAPLRTIQGSLTGLSNPADVYVDAVNNELVVTNWGNHTVTVYPRTASGNVAPVRTLGAGGPLVGIGNPGAVSVDLTNNEIAVTNCVSHPRIAFFSRTASGQVAPVRVIQGQNTLISRSFHGIAIDPVNNEVVAPNTLENAIVVYNRAASGNVAPLRVIKGPATQINKPEGIAVDTVHNEIALSNENSKNILIFSRTASGNVAPLRVITDANGSLQKPVGIWIDTVNDEITVADGDANVPQVLVYDRLANGPSTPLRVISGSNTMLNRPRQLVVDSVNSEVIVANQGERRPPLVPGNVAVYDLLENGNVAPKRFIQGAISGVGFPRAVWVDAVNNEIGEGDSKFNWIRVFPRLF
jgi:DNA-binding beta-propeller fold protein YncE